MSILRSRAAQGEQVYTVPLDAQVSAVTVNGGAVGYTLPQKGFVVITPAVSNGDTVEITYTAVPASGLVVKGKETITGLSTVKTFTVPAGATTAYVSVESQSVRMWDDGTSVPTSTDGHPLAVGPHLFEGELSLNKFIETAASAKMFVTYYGAA